MFGMKSFEERTLHPLVRDAKAHLDAAMQQETVAGKVEALLEAKERIDDAFGQEIKREDSKPSTALSVTAGAAALCTLLPATMAALSVYPAVAAMMAAVGYCFVNMSRLGKLRRAQAGMSGKALEGVKELVTYKREQALQSPRLAAKLTSLFNPSAATPNIDALVAQATAAPAKAPVAKA